MQLDCSRKTLVAAVLMTLIIGMAATPLFGDIDGATADENVKVTDMGQIWSMSAMFIFNGTDAAEITWDFGDGTPVSNEFDVKHTYAEKGVYNVTQTVKNTKGTASEIYKIEIMGYPFIEFDSMGGSDVGKIQMDAVNKPAVKPADPVKEGMFFYAWYTDSKLTEEFDWTTNITEPVKLYAGWTAEEGVAPESDDGKDVTSYVMIGAGILAIILLIAAVGTGIYLLGIPAVICGILAFVSFLVNKGLIG